MPRARSSAGLPGAVVQGRGQVGKRGPCASCILNNRCQTQFYPGIVRKEGRCLMQEEIGGIEVAGFFKGPGTREHEVTVVPVELHEQPKGERFMVRVPFRAAYPCLKADTGGGEGRSL